MRFIVVLLALCASSLALAQAYRWVDENGVVHYSDRPVEGAELIELEGAQTYTAPAPVARSQPVAAESAAGQQPGRYQSLEIVRPQNQETLWNIGATLTVSLRMSPALAPNDRIRLLYDGVQLEGLPTNSLDITLNDVFRGQHTLQAEIESSTGQTLIQSRIVTFYVQQRSILRR